MKENGTSNITGFVEFKEELNSIKILTTGWEFTGIKKLVNKDDESESNGIKVGDILIYPYFEQFKSSNKKLEIILPVVDKDTRPIVFKSTIVTYGGDGKLFLDMVNKEVIEGEELIAQYHEQLPVIQKYAQTSEQSFSLVYYDYVNIIDFYETKNETFNNSLV